MRGQLFWRRDAIADPDYDSGAIADPDYDSGAIADPEYDSGAIADPEYDSGAIAILGGDQRHQSMRTKP